MEIAGDDGQDPIGANSVTPMPKAPMAKASTPVLKFITTPSRQRRTEAPEFIPLPIRPLRYRSQFVQHRPFTHGWM